MEALVRPHTTQKAAPNSLYLGVVLGTGYSGGQRKTFSYIVTPCISKHSSQKIEDSFRGCLREMQEDQPWKRLPLVGWCRPHPSPDTGSGSHPPIPAPPQQADHRSSSSPASTGFSQSAPGAKSVWTCEQLNKCCVLCVWHWHSGHISVGCVFTVISNISILQWMNDMNNETLNMLLYSHPNYTKVRICPHTHFNNKSGGGSWEGVIHINHPCFHATLSQTYN